MRLLSFGFLAVLLFTAFTCDDNTDQRVVCYLPCSKIAIVKDLSGLDGCSTALELTNGDVLIPERRVYIQAPKPEEDPAYYFEFVPGDTVLIDYNNVELMTSCMAGKNVFLTCIREKSVLNID